MTTSRTWDKEVRKNCDSTLDDSQQFIQIDLVVELYWMEGIRSCLVKAREY